MYIKKICLIIALFISMPIFAAEPTDPKYCTMFKQLHSGMNIGDVFLLLGPPRTFGQPPTLNIKDVNSTKTPMKPLSNANTSTPSDVRARLLKSMSEDPILGSFMNAPADYENVLIWQFENDLSVSVKVKGPLVTDVKANFSCK